MSNTPLPQRVMDKADVLLSRHGHLADARAGLLAACERIVGVLEEGGILYVCGNGGSFADAVHIKGELAKSFEMPRPMVDEKVCKTLKEMDGGSELLSGLERGLPVVVLGESHSLRSAYANDRDAALIYAQELNSFAERIRCGVLLGISTSGNAANVTAAMKLAKAYGLTTISFTGPKGGVIAQLSDIDWRVPGATTADIQENQLPLYHALCKMIEAYFYGER
ncbi:MAG: SIS domain-containing protein [Sedimentisphaerales bacterium]|nr:SIS domain-containing protein [Sedimentisphaerales bacterium]